LSKSPELGGDVVFVHAEAHYDMGTTEEVKPNFRTPPG
jgi:hypothetical protein